MKRSSRLAALPPYLFAEIDAAKIRARARGVDVIDLGVGDPDLPTPAPVVRALEAAARDAENHRYPSYHGLPDFQAAVARWYERRFGVRLDPAREVLSLIGSKEGIAHLPLALVDPGDVVLVPDPGYPVYASGATFAGGEVVPMPLRRERGFLPDLSAVPTDAARRAVLLFANYPNNPTGAVADQAFFDDLVRFGQDHDVVICHDAAYTETAFDGYVAPSFLQSAGARDVGIEVHSTSKTFQMTGWRVGFAVGNADVIAALGDIKKNIDSGVFQAVQRAAIAALDLPPLACADAHATYRERRDILVAGLRAAGWDAVPQRATFYVWAPTPGGLPSIDVSKRLLDEAGIVATPGVGFGAHGEGYVRFAVTVPTDRVREAAGESHASASSVPETVVRLAGLKARGFHGMEEGERRDGQEFEIDLEFMYDAPVSAGDSLTGRVDYAEAAETALAAFGRTRFKTIEALADEIADVVLHRYRLVRWVAVRIRKRPPAWRDRLAHVEAEVVRRR